MACAAVDRGDLISRILSYTPPLERAAHVVKTRDTLGRNAVGHAVVLGRTGALRALLVGVNACVVAGGWEFHPAPGGDPASFSDLGITVEVALSAPPSTKDILRAFLTNPTAFASSSAAANPPPPPPPSAHSAAPHPAFIYFMQQLMVQQVHMRAAGAQFLALQQQQQQQMMAQRQQQQLLLMQQQKQQQQQQQKKPGGGGSAPKPGSGEVAGSSIAAAAAAATQGALEGGGEDASNWDVFEANKRLFGVDIPTELSAKEKESYGIREIKATDFTAEQLKAADDIAKQINEGKKRGGGGGGGNEDV
jgi:hypothetical protein